MVKMKFTLADLQKRFGEGTVVQYGTLKSGIRNIQRFSSGSMIINHMLGGGWPLGRIVEISGNESSGKTSLCLHAIAEIQKIGGGACFIDMEHALDPTWATNLGVNMNELFLATPNCAEDALEIAEAVVQTEDVSLVVVDSVSALVPRAEVEGDMGAAHMAIQARLMGQGLRKLSPLAAKHKTTIIFINQLRQNIGVMYGPSEVTSGGMALRFFSSIRLRVTRGKQLKEGDVTVGNIIKLRTMKNKTGIPFQDREVEFYYKRGGISLEGELGTLMLEIGLIYKNGAIYTLPATTDYSRLVKKIGETTEIVPLKEIIKSFPKTERRKVKGREEALKALRQNLNLQKAGEQALKEVGII